MLIERYYTPFTINEKSGSGADGDLTSSVVGYYKGFFQPLSSAEIFQFAKAGESVTHRLYTGLSTPYEYLYQCVQGSQSYIMIKTGAQVDGVSSVGHHREIIVRMVE